MDKREFILIADGDDSERQVLREQLSDVYRIEDFTNGKDAFDYLNQHSTAVDMVITGIEMKDIDGFELLKFLKLSKPLDMIPVLVLTEEGMQEDEVKAVEYGAADIITKPFSRTVVLNRIRNALKANNIPSYVNVMEDLVNEQIDKNIETFGICQCATCRSDLAALALNHLPPKYVSTEKGRLISATERMSYNNILEIVKAIAECAEMVKKHPRHTGIYTEK